MAAQRAGLTTILLPKSNEVDVDDIPEEVRKQVKLIFVEDMEEVLKTALSRPLKPRLRTEGASRQNIAPATS